MNLHGYPSIYNMGHAAIAELFKYPVIVEEKIDGSQISFSKINGELCARSKGAPINLQVPEGMFKAAAETILSLQHCLCDNVVYRGEYLAKPKHNVLAYDRVPKAHIIIYDVNTGLEQYLTPMEKKNYAESLGLEVVPILHSGILEDVAKLRTLLDTESILGGQKIEGVVIKPADYNLFGRDKKCLMGKFVSESFRETRAKVWSAEAAEKSNAGVMSLLAAKYTTQARWQKALQHLREAGEIQDAPADIGKLMAEVPKDIGRECAEEIAQHLYNWAWPQLRRMVTRGLPEWYKNELLKKQFETVA